MRESGGRDMRERESGGRGWRETVPLSPQLRAVLISVGSSACV